jgi:hypothetical protein
VHLTLSCRALCPCFTGSLYCPVGYFKNNISGFRSIHRRNIAGKSPPHIPFSATFDTHLERYLAKHIYSIIFLSPESNELYFFRQSSSHGQCEWAIYSDSLFQKGTLLHTVVAVLGHPKDCDLVTLITQSTTLHYTTGICSDRIHPLVAPVFELDGWINSGRCLSLSITTIIDLSLSCLFPVAEVNVDDILLSSYQSTMVQSRAAQYD